MYGGPGTHLEMSGPGSRAHMEKTPGRRAWATIPFWGLEAKGSGLSARQGHTGFRLRREFAAVTAPAR